MASANPTERENKPTSRAMTEWLERQYDAPQPVHCGPEALAWDDHGLQAARQQPAVEA
jgi:hypothetical protein